MPDRAPFRGDDGLGSLAQDLSEPAHRQRVWGLDEAWVADITYVRLAAAFEADEAEKLNPIPVGR